MSTKLSLKLKLIAMDTVTEILTSGLDRNNIIEHIGHTDLTEDQISEVVEMIRAVLLALLTTADDDRKMIKVLEKF